MEGERSKKKYLFILAVGVFGILNTEMGIVGVLPAVSEQYGVSLTTAGLLVSMFALAIAVSGPVLPMLLSRFERKKIMVFILSLFTAGNVAAAFAPNFAVLMLARMIPAFFHPVFVSFAMASASDLAESEAEAPKAVSAVMMGVSAGMVLGGPVAGLIADWSGLRMSLLFFAAVNLISMLAVILAIPEFPGKEKVSFRTQLRVLKNGKLWLALVGVILLNGSIFGVYSYISGYLSGAFGFSVQMVSVLLFLYGLMNIVGNTAAGKQLSERPGRFMSLQPLLICGIYVLLLASGTAALPAAVLVLLLGIVAGMVANTIQYWVSSEAPGAPEFANGLYLTAANLGISAAAPFCGIFINNMGMPSAPLGGIILAVFNAVCIGLKVRAMRHHGHSDGKDGRKEQKEKKGDRHAKDIYGI